LTSVTHDFVVSEPRESLNVFVGACSSKIQCHLKRTVLGANELLLVIETGTALLIYLKRENLFVNSLYIFSFGNE